MGLIAHYPTRPLDMEDDPENPRRKSTQPPVKITATPGFTSWTAHTNLSHDFWEQNMQIRAAKGNTPTKSSRPRREYLLTGIGRCLVCLEHTGDQVGFRGSYRHNGIQYYRCATIQEKSKTKPRFDQIENMVPGIGIEGQSSETWERLIQSHKPTLRSDEMEEQVNKLVSQLVIPPEWYEMIMAYYLSDNGMADFERESYNLRQELARFQDMYANGYVTQAQFKERAMTISRDLQNHAAIRQPEA